MTNSQRAWISIAKDPVGLNYGVHDGYDDEPSNYYEYDSKVGNHKQVNVGDLLFIRSGEFVLGFGQIESISITNGTKSLRSVRIVMDVPSLGRQQLLNGVVLDVKRNSPLNN
jgi:hypothetical protein